MCLQNSVQERISLSNLETLDTYDTERNERIFNDNCDYITLDDCKDINKNPHDLCIIEYNIRGLVSKQTDLHYLLTRMTNLQCVDIVILIETWLTKESESRVKIPGYEYYGKTRTHKKGGGVGFLIRNGLNFIGRPDLEFPSDFTENCFIELTGVKRNIIMGALYRPPNSNASKFVTEYTALCKRINTEKGKDSILGLDHNLNLLKHHQHKNTQDFLERMLEQSYFPCITRPTRIAHNTATLLDNILLSINLIGKQNSSIVVSDLSDHLPCLSIIKNCMITTNSKYVSFKRKLTKVNLEKIKADLCNVNWEQTLSKKGTETCMNCFHDKLLSIIDEVAPEKVVNVSTKQVISLAWMTPGIIRSSKKQLQLYKKSLTSVNESDKIKYKDYRNALNKAKRYSKISYYVQKCNEFRNDSKKLWSMINNVVGKSNNKNCVIEKLSVNNIESTNAEIIVNKLAQHFANIGKCYADKIQKSNTDIDDYISRIPRNVKSVFIRPVTESEIEKIIVKLPCKSSSGWDGLSNKLLKNIKESLLLPLKIIVNKSLEEGIFPESMKLANVKPLFKSGHRNLSTNYRPISLLPVLSKIIEKVMYARTYNFLQETQQIYQSQYGFRKRHSCENAVQELLSSVLKGKENRKYTAAIFLDLSKAFDTLEHTILFKKLEAYGIRGIALSWYKSYLSNRLLCVNCMAGTPPENCISDQQKLEYGVPQGSCLGPLLFLVYCNDLPINLVFCKSILFADDTTLYKSHEHLSYLKWCLEEEIRCLMDWFNANKLTLNLSKSVCMLFTEKTNVNFVLEIDHLTIPTVTHTKFLGVWIDCKLRWDFHISKLVLKLKRNQHLLQTGRKMLNVHAKRLVYFAHIQSHITYCITIWGNLVSEAQIRKIENLQKKCIRLITTKPKNNDHGILYVKELIELENCKFGYKLNNNLLPDSIRTCCYTDQLGKTLMKTHQYSTRQKNLPNIPKANTSKYLKSILCEGNRKYSQLDTKLKQSKNLTVFTKALNRQLLLVNRFDL